MQFIKCSRLKAGGEKMAYVSSLIINSKKNHSELCLSLCLACFNAVWRNLITLITFFDEICLDYFCFIMTWKEEKRRRVFPLWWIVLHETILDLKRENSAQAAMWPHVFIVTWKQNSAGDTSIKHGATARCLYCQSEVKSYILYMCINDKTRSTLLILQYCIWNWIIVIITHIRLRSNDTVRATAELYFFLCQMDILTTSSFQLSAKCYAL